MQGPYLHKGWAGLGWGRALIWKTFFQGQRIYPLGRVQCGPIFQAFLEASARSGPYSTPRPRPDPPKMPPAWTGVSQTQLISYMGFSQRPNYGHTPGSGWTRPVKIHNRGPVLSPRVQLHCRKSTCRKVKTGINLSKSVNNHPQSWCRKDFKPKKKK